ncbi:MAG: ammonia-forming cytochrome c nitrite reductase subunit c552 [Lentisphaerae bacterium]|nr:ammonia-forming cytochrome c nitrite reductase subunit c552 [Lentisphaerota bacterium]
MSIVKNLKASQSGLFLRGVVVATIVTAAVAVGVTALLMNVLERKLEARNPFYRVVEITDDTIDPAIWGKNFPLQYDLYLRTVDMERTHHGGSEAFPRATTDEDPRSVVSQSKLEEEPRLRKMWAGYGFAIDFREERGHAHMLTDQLHTGRHAKPMPGTCLNCHASTYPIYKELGDGDIMAGFAKMNQMTYFDAAKLAKHPVACIDCHDAETMHLRITRPAFIEGIRDYKGAVEGIADYDVNTMATRHEMRTYVCAQCHVEYYFKGEEKRLTFPWTKGMKGDDILAYYDEIGFKDWTHKETGAASLKAQHPEFETWSQGIHARSGVTCADCHMPYKRVGSMKISDHHVNSPYLKVNHACQTCHKQSEDELKLRIENIQGKTIEMKELAMNSLMDLIDDCKAAKARGTDAATLGVALDYQRKATFLLDFVEAENSTGFHAPQESARILMLSLDNSRKGQRLLSVLPTESM